MKNDVPLKVLHLEDSEDDAVLVRLCLRREGFPCEITVATKKQEFESALRDRAFDLILSDYSIPGYDGEEALRSAREVRPEVPFVFVSGTIGEDRAVEALRAGATDYILKERLDRLGAAIRRAVRESSERALRKKAEAERKELEEQLRQAQKLEAVGQLAGGVAHDFNNLLVVIQGYTEMLLLTETGISTDGKESLKQVLATAQRASNLTRQLLTFSRKQPLAPKVLDFNMVIDEMLKMLRRVVETSVELELDAEKGLAAVFGDRGMIEQVLMNLVLNARDAMPNGGQVRVSTRATKLGREGRLRHPEAREGDFVCLCVRDTGSGIAPENLLRVFEPFFTTKKPGTGTGLGLATVYGIVKQHGGWVEVASTLGKGTQFEVFLPVHTANPAGGEEQPAPIGGTEKILLAEDDESVRRFTARALQGLGYQVVEAGTGKAAVECWTKARGDFNLLLADILLPDGQTGHELADELRRSNPGLKVIFTSGFPHPTRATDTSFFRRGHFLQKPYTAQELALVVRRCLDEQQSGKPPEK